MDQAVKSQIGAKRFARTVVVVLIVLWLGWLVFGVLTSRDQVRINDVEFVPPSSLLLSVSSCGSEPKAEVFETDRGLEIDVRRTKPATTKECLDQVTVSLDEPFDTLVVVDRKSGDSFTIQSE